MKQKIKFRFLSFLTALAVATGIFTIPTTAMAAEVTTDSLYQSVIMEDETAQVQRAPSRDNPLTDYWGHAIFKGGCWGENTHIINGANARLCIAFRPTDGNYKDSFKVRIRAYDVINNNHNRFDFEMEYNPKTLDSDHYHMYVGEYRTGDYPLMYKIFYEPLGSSSSREIEYHVWVDYY